MTEVTFTLTEDEARALLPRPSAKDSVQEWNRRQDLAEDAHAKIRATLRDQVPQVPAGQESLGGLV